MITITTTTNKYDGDDNELWQLMTFRYELALVAPGINYAAVAATAADAAAIRLLYFVLHVLPRSISLPGSLRLCLSLSPSPSVSVSLYLSLSLSQYLYVSLSLPIILPSLSLSSLFPASSLSCLSLCLPLTVFVRKGDGSV